MSFIMRFWLFYQADPARDKALDTHLASAYIDFFGAEDPETGIKQVAPGLKYLFIGIGVAMVVGFGAYTRSLGRPLMFVLILIMMPLATTEIGTDGWIMEI